ncbi:MAG TPA: N-acetylglucosamine-6-phosphate deacetylase [Armatimonadota bacterium]|nr:N-acetylglucosamine-6-phosphate deacetylase [Armatimonadota bacterium]
MPEHNTIVFAEGTVITPTRRVEADLVIEDGRVVQMRKRGTACSPHEQVVDCRGLFVGPGLVDIHVHGGQGHDFVTDDPQEIIAGCEYHLSVGTTSIAPSGLSVPIEQMRAAISAARAAQPDCRGDILGYHVEGMYLDQEYRGGHLAEYVRDPDPAEYLPLIEDHGDFITEWTLAPELPGSLDVIRALRAAGIPASVGHSQATYEEMLAAIDAGLCHATHLYCVMGSIRFEALRQSTGKGYAPGAIETVLMHQAVTTEVICDGFHLHPALIRFALACKGPHRLALVSDAMMGVGLPDGEYFIGGQDCLVQGGIAIIKVRPEVIASSVTPMIGMLRFAHQTAGIPLEDAWTMGTLTPARIIGVADRKGSLDAGKDADLILLDRDLNLQEVYARGRQVATHR